MSELADMAERTQRFKEAVRALTPPSPRRHAKLMPTKEGIIELRQKGASIGVIRELLATVGVAVGTDTIARFLAEVNGESPRRQISKRSYRRRETVATITSPPRGVRSPILSAHTEPPSERSRARGPRVADPRNL